MKQTRRNPIQGQVNEYQVDSPAPSNINYFWGFGSLLGQNLIVLIISGITLAMHYTPNTQMAFNSIEHIMRDVNNGWQIRYIHANGASFFFIFVYQHIARGLYYGSYRSPRGQLWGIGVIIYIIMMATAFIGYVQPWGLTMAQDDYIYLFCYYPLGKSKISTRQRIGPHNLDILSVLVGNLLGDGHGELRSGSPRFTQHMSSRNMEYLYWLHNFYHIRGYCSSNVPKFKPQIGKKGKVYFSGKLNTYSFSSLLWLYEMFYVENVKIIPRDLSPFLTPLALAIWIMDEGGKYNRGTMISTYNFTLNDLEYINSILKARYNLVANIEERSAGYVLVFKVNQMVLLSSIVKPYILPSMQYKLNGYCETIS